jgi:hypothetical protein
MKRTRRRMRRLMRSGRKMIRKMRYIRKRRMSKTLRGRRGKFESRKPYKKCQTDSLKRKSFFEQSHKPDPSLSFFHPILGTRHNLLHRFRLINASRLASLKHKPSEVE